jgi:SAM-dependent methyltransferase
MSEFMAVPDFPPHRPRHDSPPGALEPERPQQFTNLSSVDHASLLLALLERLQDGAYKPLSALELNVADALLERLQQRLDVHENRFGRRRYSDLLWVFHRQLQQPLPDYRGKTVLEIGCGAQNPLAMGLVYRMLGAAKVFAVDLDPVQNPARAARGLARLLDAAMQDPHSIFAELEPSREQILENVRDIDFAALRQGEMAGAGPNLVYWNKSAMTLDLPDRAVDVVITNSFLEHIEDLDAILREIGRLMRPGGYSIHSIDGRDHHYYGNASMHEIEFLRVPHSGMVRGCNRLRMHEYPAMFEKHGFIIQQFLNRAFAAVSEADRASFAEPWRSMTLEQLRVVEATLVARWPQPE